MRLWNPAARPALALRAHPVGDAGAVDRNDSRDPRGSAEKLDDGRCRFHRADCSERSYKVKPPDSDFRNRRSDFLQLDCAAWFQTGSLKR